MLYDFEDSFGLAIIDVLNVGLLSRTAACLSGFMALRDRYQRRGEVVD